GIVALDHAHPRTVGRIGRTAPELRGRRVGPARSRPADRGDRPEVARAMNSSVSQRPPLNWRSSTPDQIESDLAGVWLDLAKSGPVSRALMSNVIVVAECAEDADMRAVCEGLPLAELARLHPARTIVVGYASGVQEKAAPRSACVSVMTIGTGAAR